MGHEALLKPGEVQRISAGTGIAHSELKYSPIQPVHLLQIWIQQDRKGGKPAYAERSFVQDAARPGLTLVTSSEGRAGSVSINQDADVWLGRWEAGASATHAIRPGRHAWLQAAEGEVTLDGQTLRDGDGAALSGGGGLTLVAQTRAEALWFDLD
jgi:redox-sensitive bicupin YhaK (pirin superfamily)